jgi:hypothetical protein
MPTPANSKLTIEEVLKPGCFVEDQTAVAGRIEAKGHNLG